jgi:hypothetical protein
MLKRSHFLSGMLIFALMIFVMAGCKSETTPTSTPGSSVDPTSTPEADDPFQISVVPEQFNGFTIAGQRCVFLVTITDEAQGSGAAVDITAEAAGAEVSIEKNAITEGQVSEVTVIPAQSSIGKAVEVTFTGKRGSVSEKKVISFDVIEGEDDRKEYAEELRDRFVAWLAEAHPELGIKSDTEWTGTMVSPQWLVVSHYLFFSDEWEMHVEWHIMIAPSDWARIDLRKRYEELKPSLAFELSSRSTDDDPISITVPDFLWR